MLFWRQLVVLFVAIVALVGPLPVRAQTQAQVSEASSAFDALALPLRQPDDLTPLIDAVGEARWVLLGESSHGTSDFYTWRDAISRRLIQERGFSFIALEGDWTELAPFDRYVRGLPDAPASAREALLRIQRWPLWMWANEEMVALGEWLRDFNRSRAPHERVGIHGIDIYGLWISAERVRAYYAKHLPDVAEEVARLHEPLLAFEGDGDAYARHVTQTQRSAESGVARVAEKIEARYRGADADMRDELFELLQHAKIVKYGEAHLRGMAQSGPESWNARATHFKLSVSRLLDHYGSDSRAIVWAHNTHIGDARATSMPRFGQVNIGQLAREHHGDDAVFAVGFATATGTVLAARSWQGRREVMETPVPRVGSLEAALLAAGNSDRLLVFDRDSALVEPLLKTTPHRAIGVVFKPEDEPRRNYVPTRLVERYDALVFLAETRALKPLHEE